LAVLDGELIMSIRDSTQAEAADLIFWKDKTPIVGVAFLVAFLILITSRRKKSD
jgi:hypothetical protein